MDKLTELAGALIAAGAPILGGAIGGPGGALAGKAIGALAEALGVPATPEAVKAAVEADPASARRAEASWADLLADQVAVNAAQAVSPSFFVAGARPAAMWATIAILTYEGLLRQIITWACANVGILAPTAVPGPIFDAAMWLLFGLAGVRGAEAVVGVARESLDAPRPTGAVVAAVKKGR